MRTPEARVVKTDVGTVALSIFLHIYVNALLSKRCNFVRMIATKIFIRTILVENFMQNIF